MPGGRKTTAAHAGETLEGPMARGCPQWYVLLFLLWSQDVDELIEGLNENGCYIFGMQMILLS